MQNPDEDTEWNDILRAKGILPQKPAELEISESDLIDMLEQTIADKTTGRTMDNMSLDELDELEDDFLVEDEQIVQEYRLKRMAELKRMYKLERFGHMVDISQTEFVREVTQASKEVWVVCFLYKPAYTACNLLKYHLDLLAAKYKQVKFVSIIGDKCIPNYPDRNLPTLLIYGQGDLKYQQVGLHGLGGMLVQTVDVEDLLVKAGAVTEEMRTSCRSDNGRRNNNGIEEQSKVRAGQDADSDYDY